MFQLLINLGKRVIYVTKVCKVIYFANDVRQRVRKRHYTGVTYYILSTTVTT